MAMDTTDAEALREAGARRGSTSYKPSLVLARGSGMEVWDSDGKRYLDFLAGIAVDCLGQCHPRIVEAISRQAGELLQISNAFLSPVQIRVQEKLAQLSFGDRTFLCNSGAEANEAAIKLARRTQRIVRGQTQRTEIITFEHSFHGRTLATITATGQPKYHVGFEPLPEGFRYARFNDIESVKALASDKTVAIMVEPVQGEGGVRPAAPGFLAALRQVADEVGALLIYDEVQCGVGRTGRLFAYEHDGVPPDIMTLAKGLGGGVAIGAMISTDAIFEGFVVGSHASTFGGNPLACAAAEVVLDVVADEAFLEKVRRVGAYLRAGLDELVTPIAFREVRGLGLMMGAEVGPVAKAIVVAARNRGLLINAAGGETLRFVPPLIATEANVDEALSLLGEALRHVASDAPLGVPYPHEYAPT